MNFPVYDKLPVTEENVIDALVARARASSEASHNAIKEAQALAESRRREEDKLTQQILSMGRK